MVGVLSFASQAHSVISPDTGMIITLCKWRSGSAMNGLWGPGSGERSAKGARGEIMDDTLERGNDFATKSRADA